MKKLLLTLLAFSIVLVGCSGETVKGFPDTVLIDVDDYRTALNDNKEFSKYVEEVKFIGEVDENISTLNYFLDVVVKANNDFESLSKEDIYHLMFSMVKEIEDEPTFEIEDTDTRNLTFLRNLVLSTSDNNYVMGIKHYKEEYSYKYELVINDSEVYRPEKEQELNLKANATEQKEAEERKIYNYMESKYNEITNNGADYIPEIHDPMVDKMVSKKFDITENEANRIYLEFKLDY
ncbi:hypothetical protein ACDI16_02625 [Oceanobacillus caeni]|uniref:hypothetical protein n=1 Tax=Virgibacillus sp. SK37 TaxID=403957 RepID=UPI0011A05972|nr:hypothetical protein [Virgibacillus sp. SK37]